MKDVPSRTYTPRRVLRGRTGVRTIRACQAQLRKSRSRLLIASQSLRAEPRTITQPPAPRAVGAGQVGRKTRRVGRGARQQPVRLAYDVHDVLRWFSKNKIH